MPFRSMTLMLTVGALCVASTAAAFQPDVDSAALEISRPSYALQMNPVHRRALNTASLAERDLGGNWSVYSWNPATQTPRWILGSGVAEPAATTAVADDVQLAGFARAWADEHAAFFQAGTSELVGGDVVRGKGKIGVHFTQEFHGLPVIEGWSTLVYTDSGRLIAFGSNLYPDVDVSPVPLISGAAATTIAKQDVPFDPAIDRVEGEPELMVLPIELETGVTHHLVWRVRVTTTEPLGIWVTHVDAHSSRILWRTNDVHFLYEGSSFSDVEINTYCDGTTPDVALSDMEIEVSGVGIAETDSTGAFEIPGDAGSQTVEAIMDGTNLRVFNHLGSNAMISGPIEPAAPFDFYWDDTNSDPSERDAFYWVNASNHYLDLIDPEWTYSKYTCNVNLDATCNATWSGTTLRFYREGGGCAATGRIGDVVAHEYGHGVQSRLVGGQGNEGLGEGNGDIMGTFMTDDPVIGRGFSLNACSSGIRDCNNNLIYPNHVVGRPIHSAGRVICGFNWDMRQAMEATHGAEDGKTKTAEIWHFARKVLRPVYQPDQVIAYFIIDDDDGDLSNGTPNYDDICAGATAHNFDCPEVIQGVVIQHTPLVDTIETASDYELQAAIFSTDGALVADSLLVVYRTNLGEFSVVNLVPAGGANLFTALIPAQDAGTLVQYYIMGRDVVGNRNTHPEFAPGVTHTFMVGSLTTSVLEEMEVDPGWTVGPTTASTGAWERVDPVAVFRFVGGLQVQITPEDDTTPAPGVQCWVTEQDVPGGFAGDHDVDNGYTTLRTVNYDLSEVDYARVVYKYWFSNDRGGHPGEDPFSFDVSSNGGATWTTIEESVASTYEWEDRQFDVANHTALTAQMLFRFVARDDQSAPMGASLVEAGIDDFMILTWTSGAVSVAGASGASPLRSGLAQNQPNPFNPSTAISYALAGDGAVTLRVYDVGGKLVRSLVERHQEAGEYTVLWDGADARDQSVSSGIYFYRLDAGDFTRTRKMVLLK